MILKLKVLRLLFLILLICNMFGLLAQQNMYNLQVINIKSIIFLLICFFFISTFSLESTKIPFFLLALLLISLSAFYYQDFSLMVAMLCYIVLFVLVYNSKLSVDDIKHIFKFYSYIVSLICIIFIVAYYYPSFLHYNITINVEGIKRLCGFFENPNSLALAIGPCCVFILACYMLEPGSLIKGNILRLISFLPIIYCLYLSGNRSMFVGIIVAVVFILKYSRLSNKEIFGYLSFFICAGIVIYFTESKSSAAYSSSRHVSLLIHFVDDIVAIKLIISKYILFENVSKYQFMTYDNMNLGKFGEPNNAYIYLFVKYGILAGVSYLVFITKIFSCGLKRLKKEIDSVILFAVLVSILVSNLFHSEVQNSFVMICFALIYTGFGKANENFQLFKNKVVRA